MHFYWFSGWGVWGAKPPQNILGDFQAIFQHFRTYEIFFAFLGGGSGGEAPGIFWDFSFLTRGVFPDVIFLQPLSMIDLNSKYSLTFTNRQVINFPSGVGPTPYLGGLFTGGGHYMTVGTYVSRCIFIPVPLPPFFGQCTCLFFGGNGVFNFCKQEVSKNFPVSPDTLCTGFLFKGGYPYLSW